MTPGLGRHEREHGVLMVSVPVSPYCELARWVLDRLGVAYVEQCHAPFLHLPAALRHGGRSEIPVLSVPGASMKNAREVLQHYERHCAPELRLYPDERGDRAETERLVDLFYDDLGVAVRAWAYAEMLPVRAVTADLWTAGAPGIERLAVRYGYPVLAVLMRRALRITPATYRQALAEVERGFDQVEALLSDGRRHLVGDAFSAADLTFAALTGPAVLPTGYGGPLPTSQELPAGMAADHERLRNGVAGAFALRLYQEDRPRPQPGTSSRCKRP